LCRAWRSRRTKTVVQFNREQTISIAVLCLLLLVCVFAVGLSLQVRSNAAYELSERSDTLSHLAARARSGADARARTTTVAPAAAFLDAGTAGLAAAQLQTYLSQVAARQQAILISYGVEPARREDSPDAIRVQVTLEVSQKSVQGLLYQLESATPYVFVDSLAVQTPSTTGQRGAQDANLRLTLSLRALWRRGSA
jgi:general secretion pathway protein M